MLKTLFLAVTIFMISSIWCQADDLYDLSKTEKYSQYAAFDWGFGFGSGTGTGGPTYYFLREDGSAMLREDGSKFLREDAP